MRAIRRCARSTSLGTAARLATGTRSRRRYSATTRTPTYDNVDIVLNHFLRGSKLPCLPTRTVDLTYSKTTKLVADCCLRSNIVANSGLQALDVNGQTPLHMAAAASATGLTNVLLGLRHPELPPGLTALDRHGRSPLRLAVVRGWGFCRRTPYPVSWLSVLLPSTITVTVPLEYSSKDGNNYRILQYGSG